MEIFFCQILVIFTYFQGILPQYLFFIYQLDLIDEFILIGLTFYWILRIFIGQSKFKRTPFDIPVLFLLVFVLFSSVLNSNSPFISILALRDTFQYILLFYVFVQLRIEEKNLLALFKILYKIALLQFFVLIIQLSFFYYKTKNLYLEDFANGTFGSHGSHKLGYFMGMMIVTSLLIYLQKRNKKYLIHSFLFFIALVLTSCRSALFITGIVLIFLFKNIIFKNIKVLFSSLLILVLSVSLIYFYYKASTGDVVMVNPEAIFKQQFGTKPGVARRLGVLHYCYNLLIDSKHLLIGFSPGAIGKTSMYFPRKQFFEEDPILYQIEGPFVINQASVAIIEYGILGNILVFFIFYRIYSINNKMIVYNKKNNSLRIFNLIFKGVFLIYFLGIFAEKVFEIQEISFYFWFLFSTAYLLNKYSKKI